MEYKIIKKGTIEKMESFEKKLNTMSMAGWRVITSYHSGMFLIMGKEKH